MDFYGILIFIVGLGWSVILLLREKKTPFWSWVAGGIAGVGAGFTLGAVVAYAIVMTTLK